MRIISKFRDYYDSVQAHGIDPALVYRREPKLIDVHDHLFLWNGLRRLLLEAPLYHNQIEVIAFCGRAYSYARIQYLIPRDTIIERGPFVSSAELREGLIAMGREYPGEYWFERRTQSLGDPASKDSLASEFDRYIHDCAGQVIPTEFFRQFGAPVLRIRSEGIYHHESFSVLTNPVLKEYRFAQRFEPYSCYQEIAMYLGNQLAQPDIAPQVVGDDETLARAKGFDDKSFRTQAPGSKKLNRKANRARKKGS